MTAILALLAGKKTYLLMGVGALVVLANHFIGPVPLVKLDPNNWVNDLWTIGVGSTFRSAIGGIFTPVHR